MGRAVTIVFPHQLFREHPAVSKDVPVYLVEETLFFHQFPFHKKKILLHRASMKAYESFLRARTTVHYIDAGSPDSDIRQLIKHLGQEGVTELHFADPVDDWLRRRLDEAAATGKMRLQCFPTPNFLNTSEEIAGYFNGRGETGAKQSKTYFLADFYISERKKRNWLIDETGKPRGGKWSFDADNRKRLPASQGLPFVSFPKKNPFVAEATEYVARHFSSHSGDLSPLPGDGFYPIDFRQADAWLDQFLAERLQGFGPFEDAMRSNAHFLFHSVLTPMLNIGLLDPGEIIRRVLAFASRNNIPLPSVEGFLRQVAGWREFMRILYEREGRKQRTQNFWAFSRRIPDSFRRGETGIIPVDTVIRKVLATGYAHHIERLMILGNFMLLCEFHPDEVYGFFMEFFIDAYDWVMVPNVYGMSQFADGGLMTTKPYFSASHYLRKMGDWKPGPWEDTWNGLFWRFLSVHHAVFIQQPRWKMLLAQWDRMPEDLRLLHLRHAEDFLRQMKNPEPGTREKNPDTAPELF